MFTKILVCLDGSIETERIIPYAVAQAQHFNSHVVFIRVIDIPRAAIPASITTTSGEDEVREVKEQECSLEEEKKAADYLARLSLPLQQGGINVDCVTVRGTPAESITAYAEQYGVDLIIITTGESGLLGRVLFGSVTDFIMRNARASVLAIKPEKE